MIQQHRLQVCWIRQLFQVDGPVFCSQVYLTGFVRRLYSMCTTSLLSLFYLSLRVYPNVSFRFFLTSPYTAMNIFLNNGFSDVRCNPSILLRPLLLTLFTDIPENHWLLSHSRSKMQTHRFLPRTVSSKGFNLYCNLTLHNILDYLPDRFETCKTESLQLATCLGI
jgi:hypothetical protein